MDDGSRNEKYQSFIDTLRDEWRVFWEGLSDKQGRVNQHDEKNTEDPFQTGKISVLNSDQIKVITKALSSDRRKLNREIEALNKEIDLLVQKLSTLELVGGEKENTLKELEKLNDLGQQMSIQLEKLNSQLKQTRSAQDLFEKSKN